MRRRVEQWLIAFWREGRQSGLFLGYLIGCILVILLSPADVIVNAIGLSTAGVLVVVAILFRLRKHKE